MIAIPRFLQRPGGTDDIVFREVWEENVYHLERGDFARSGVAVDIGANVGAFALYAAHLGARRVIAYEPEEENYRCLLENLATHRDLAAVVEPSREALWSHDRALATLATHGGAQVTEDLGAGPSVPARTLDGVFRDRGVEECEVLKIDTEGAEYAIFQGLSIETQNRCRRIVLEFHPAPGDPLGRLLTQLTRTHKFFVLGSVDRGGYVWAERY